MITDEMVEVVARVLAEQDTNSDRYGWYKVDARAALEAVAPLIAAEKEAAAYIRGVENMRNAMIWAARNAPVRVPSIEEPGDG